MNALSRPASAESEAVLNKFRSASLNGLKELEITPLEWDDLRLHPDSLIFITVNWGSTTMKVYDVLVAVNYTK